MQTSGLILDLYDDFQGDVLSTIYSSTEEVPALVKEAHHLKEAELRALPDDVFALVAVADGGVKMRKFACTDPGNTALSVEYFLKTAHKLPLEAQKQAAQNLVTACGWYGIDPPSTLQKIALMGTVLKGVMALPAAQGAHAEAKENVQRIKQAPPGTIINPFQKHGQAGAPIPPMGSQQSAPLSTAAPMQPPGPGMAQMGMQSTAMPTAGTSTPPAMTAQPTPKMAEAALTYVMPAASEGSEKQLKRKAPIKTAAGCGGTEHKRARLKAAMMKKAEVGHLVVGHGGDKDMPPQTETDPSKGLERQVHEKVFRQGLDLRGKEPPVKQTEKKAQHVALGRYPMDNFHQIKTASIYFETWGGKMAPEHKREFCQLLVKRADAIGRSALVSYDARKYGSSTYAPTGEIKMAMDMRRSVLNDSEAHRILDGLFEKMATVSADIFCEALHQFDQDYGLHHHYGGHVPDPFWSTYGFQKKAMLGEKDDELQAVGTEVISRRQLTDSANPAISTNILGMLEEKFGDEFQREFQKDPIGIFESLPIEQKTFIARFINDNGVSPTAD